MPGASADLFLSDACSGCVRQTMIKSADLSRRALNTPYLILKTPLYLRPGLKFGHVAKHTVKQVRNSSNSLKFAHEGWGVGSALPAVAKLFARQNTYF